MGAAGCVCLGARLEPGPSLSPGGWLLAADLGPAPDPSLVAVVGTTWGTGFWCKGHLGWKEPSWSRLGYASPAASPKRC